MGGEGIIAKYFIDVIKAAILKDCSEKLNRHGANGHLLKCYLVPDNPNVSS